MVFIFISQFFILSTCQYFVFSWCSVIPLVTCEQNSALRTMKVVQMVWSSSLFGKNDVDFLRSEELSIFHFGVIWLHVYPQIFLFCVHQLKYPALYVCVLTFLNYYFKICSECDNLMIQTVINKTHIVVISDG